jgi:hypothetical protein
MFSRPAVLGAATPVSGELMGRVEFVDIELIAAYIGGRALTDQPISAVPRDFGIERTARRR